MARAENVVDIEPRWITGEELSRMTIKKHEALIEDLLPADGVVLLTADAKGGKSTLSLELCRAVTTGTPALERFSVPASRPAIYWQADDTSQQRFIRNYQEITNGTPLPNFAALVARLPLAMGGIEELDSAIRRTGARLAVVDCLTSVRAARTSDFVVQEYDELRGLSELATERHVCILVLHHLASGRRATGGNPFIGNAGSFSLNGGADGLMTLGLFSVTRPERAVTVIGRDTDASRFVYARDAAKQLFYVAGADLADIWEDAFRLYRLIGDQLFGAKEVAEALGIGDRQGRNRLARLRLAGAADELNGKQAHWQECFTAIAKRVIGGMKA